MTALVYHMLVLHVVKQVRVSAYTFCTCHSTEMYKTTATAVFRRPTGLYICEWKQSSREHRYLHKWIKVKNPKEEMPHELCFMSVLRYINHSFQDTMFSLHKWVYWWDRIKTMFCWNVTGYSEGNFNHALRVRRWIQLLHSTMKVQREGPKSVYTI